MIESSNTAGEPRERARFAHAAITGSPGGAEPAAIHPGIDWMELLLILACRKKAILRVTIGIAAVTGIVMFLIPNVYTATASILPPEQKQSSLGAMLGQIGSIAGLNESDLGIKTPGDL